MPGQLLPIVLMQSQAQYVSRRVQDHVLLTEARNFEFDRDLLNGLGDFELSNGRCERITWCPLPHALQRAGDNAGILQFGPHGPKSEGGICDHVVLS